MDSQVLILTSCPRSGTRFTMKFLEKHPEIGQFYGFDMPVRHHSYNPVCKPLQGLGGLTSINTLNGYHIETPQMIKQQYTFKGIQNRLRSFYESQFPTHQGKYRSFFGHITNPGYIWPLIALKPFDFKVVAPIRHPLSVLISDISSIRLAKQRGINIPTSNGSAWEFHDYISVTLKLVASLKAHGNFLPLPLDLLSAKPPKQRQEEMRALVEEYLEITLTESQISFIDSWKPIAHFKKSEYAEVFIPEEVMQGVRVLVRESGILELLGSIGVDYSESPPIPNQVAESIVDR